MEHLAQLLQEHFRNHPGMELRDAIKFLYQSSMGGGHLIADPRGALARLEEEWTRTEGAPALSPTEPLGGGLCRLSLAACKGLGLAPSTVFALFLRGTEEFSRQPERLDRSLELLYRLPFPPKEIEAAIRQYRAAGLPMVGHSTAYRQAFSPAYRVVLQSDAALLPLLAAIDRSRREHPRTLTAMDGPCATGKSTLGARLARLYSCPLFHMDDFFLPPERKTPERLAQPGGNVDYERFFAQVLSPLSRGEPVLYQPYRCHSGTLEAARTIPPAPLAVVEGVYSLRPESQSLYQVKCFLTAPWPVREARLLDRCGPDGLERFRTLWIPLEDQYFQVFSISGSCDVHLETGSGQGGAPRTPAD